jgi:hypothetical protein
MRTFTGVDAIAACSGSSLARILKGSVQPRLVAYSGRGSALLRAIYIAMRKNRLIRLARF